jgi:anti-anti-sigma regulatory factor
MLNIQRTSNGRIVFSLSGRVEIEDIPELQRLLNLEAAGREIAFDLKEVTLVDREAVKFLANWEAQSIKLENCPAYIREWIDADRVRRKTQV